jgi:hypothetical protein
MRAMLGGFGNYSWIGSYEISMVPRSHEYWSVAK